MTRRPLQDSDDRKALYNSDDGTTVAAQDGHDQERQSKTARRGRPGMKAIKGKS
jgi:hypothetical protein